MKQTPESTADYLDRHMIEAMKELAKVRFNPNKRQTMKQTAVEWLENELKKIPFIKPQDAFEQAKEMEKQQIIDAFENGEDNIDSDGCSIDRNGAEQYYKQKYGGNK
jgi:hypothetical protein